MSKTLQDMGRIGRMVLDSELAQLKDANREMDEIRKTIQALDAELAARSKCVMQEDAQDLALLTGQDEPWRDWIGARQGDARQALAKAAAEREEKLARARHAFGRVQAIEALQNRARQARLQKLRKG